MYLKEVTLKNFRKFSDKNNTVSLVRGHEIYEEESEEISEDSDSKADNESNSESEKEQKDIEKYNFAKNITLIVGKNNSGKTTIIRALEKISNTKRIKSSDFNNVYLNKIFEGLKELNRTDNLQDIDNIDSISPELSFSMKIGFDHNKNDLLSVIYPFLEMRDLQEGNMEIDIEIKWILKEQENFLTTFNQRAVEYESFTDFCKLIDETEFEIKYYRSNKEIKDFNIKNLLNLHVINATKVREPESSLSKAFNKILLYRFKNILNNENIDDLKGEIERNEKDFVNKLKEDITGFNKDLSGELDTNINTNINEALENVVSDDIFEIILTSNLDIDKLLRNVIQYSYSEDGYVTLEDNFGLGYSNLVMVIAEIIDYISRYQRSDSTESAINLIVIEEPEVHMHPQMQENFILNVEKMINSLLSNFDKKISTQIIITTHSPHILNSKIHSGNSFNNINYINSEKSFSKAVTLYDDYILSNHKSMQTDESSSTRDKRAREQLTFLKKHIKFQISEIFFSDAVIFVEGATEFTLLPYYLESDIYLSKKFITLAMVDGAHAHMYFPLLRLLEIPSLIITDMDIIRESDEKENYAQIDDNNINGRETTNNILISIYRDNFSNIINEGLIQLDENIFIATQNECIESFLPTSFEEAYILENIENNSLIEALKKTKPLLSKEWISDDGKIIKEKSFEMQMKLDGSKVEFPSNILLTSIKEDEISLPKLPTYIEEGFKCLSKMLKGDP